MKQKLNFLPVIINTTLFVLLTILLVTVEVKEIGLENSKVGLSTLNQFISINHNIELWDEFSDLIMYLGILLIIIFAIIGLFQLLKRKSLKKVDSEIISLGIMIILMTIIWVIFDKFLIINFRPIFVEGKIESSYPSTHVMIVTFMFLSSSRILKHNLKNKIIYIFSILLTILFILISMVSRLLSNMHWLTDVFGGLLIGLIFYTLFIEISKFLKNRFQ